jgi:hypothetical protein
MIAVRILALLGWTIVRMVILPLAALHYVNGVVIIEVLQPAAGQLLKLRRDAEREGGAKVRNGLVEASVDG